MKLGEILVRAGVLDETGVQQGLQQAAGSGQRVGSALLELGLVSSDVLAAALGKQHGVTPASEKNFTTIESEVLAELSAEEAHQYCALPLGIVRSTQELAIAMRDPHDLSAIDALGFATGKKICPAAACEARIERGLAEHYASSPTRTSGGASDDAPLDLDLGPLPPSEPAPSEPAPSEPAPSEPAPVLPGTPDDESSVDAPSFFSSGKNLIFAALGVLALAAGAKIAYGLFQSDVGVPVYGEFEAEFVGLTIDLPDTQWLYLEQENQSMSLGNGINVKASVFYRGADSENPEDAIGLYRVTGPFPAELTEREFDQMTRGLGRGSGESAKGFTLRDLDCERSDRRVGQTAGCDGIADFRGHEYDLLGYVWFEDRSLISAFFFSKSDIDSLDSEVDSILSSIEPF